LEESKQIETNQQMPKQKPAIRLHAQMGTLKRSERDFAPKQINPFAPALNYFCSGFC
jgi:hypothetical protein